jgi:hypothetical protein
VLCLPQSGQGWEATQELKDLSSNHSAEYIALGVDDDLEHPENRSASHQLSWTLT